MATKYTAPPHTSSIDFSTGRSLPVGADGCINAPDDLSHAELVDLIRLGFAPAAIETPAPAEGDTDAKPTKAKG